MTNAADRVEAYVVELTTRQRGLDKDIVHTMNDVELRTEDLSELVAKARAYDDAMASLGIDPEIAAAYDVPADQLHTIDPEARGLVTRPGVVVFTDVAGRQNVVSAPAEGCSDCRDGSCRR